MSSTHDTDVALLRAQVRDAVEQLAATPETLAGQSLPDAVGTVIRAMKAAQRAHIEALEDNAMLLGVLRQLDYTDPAKAERLLARVRDLDVPGRMLMAEYITNVSDLKGALERERSAVRTAQDLVDHYRALANRHAEDLKAALRRLDHERGVVQSMIEALRSVLPVGFRGDNPVWACEKIADRMADLRGQVEYATERAQATEQAAARYWRALTILVQRGGAK